MMRAIRNTGVRMDDYDSYDHDYDDKTFCRWTPSAIKY